MKRRVRTSLFIFLLLVSSLSAATKTDSGTVDDERIDYHNGPVTFPARQVCFVWYGDLSGNDQAARVIGRVVVSVCESTYFLIDKVCPEFFGGGLDELREGQCALSYP